MNAASRQGEFLTSTVLGSRRIPTTASDRRGEHPLSGYWVEPRTRHVYPLEFRAYRRRREAEERPLSGHRCLGNDVEAYVWRRWGSTRSPDVETFLTLRADTSPRIRRLVAEILRLIRRGRPAAEAIRRVSRRFGLRQRQARACLATCLGFTTCPRGDAMTRLTERPWLS